MISDWVGVSLGISHLMWRGSLVKQLMWCAFLMICLRVESHRDGMFSSFLVWTASCTPWAAEGSRHGAHVRLVQVGDPWVSHSSALADTCPWVLGLAYRAFSILWVTILIPRLGLYTWAWSFRKKPPTVILPIPIEMIRWEFLQTLAFPPIH